MSLTCPDFDRLSRELLDDLSGRDLLDLERSLDDHASGCGRCGPIWRQLTRLQQVLRVGLPKLEPASPEFLNRLKVAALEEFERPAVVAWSPAARRAAWVSAAAAILAVVALGFPRRDDRIPIRDLVRNRPAPSRPNLNRALALATSATLGMAREASAPAARIGLDVIDLPETTLGAASPDLSVGVAVPPATEVLQSVGRKVNRSVKPISGSARQAFGFLLGPSLASRAGGNEG